MTWKQPIPTSFLKNESLDILDRMIFSYLRSMTRNEDGYINFYHGNKYISHFLKRGQVIFKAKSISDNLKIGYKRIQRSLEKIRKTENEMEIERKSFGQVITWVGYDTRIKMAIETENKGKSKGKGKENEGGASNKSVKSDKEWEENFEEIWKLYPKKSGKDRARKSYLSSKPDKQLVIEKIGIYKSFIEQEREKGFNRKYKDGGTWFYQKGWEDEYEVKTLMQEWIDLQKQKRSSGNDVSESVLARLKELKPQVLGETGRTEIEYIKNGKSFS